MKKLIVKIKRQRTPASAPYFETFKVPFQEQMTVLSVLEWIAMQPVNIDGQAVGQVAWSHSDAKHSGQSVMLVNSQTQDIRHKVIDSTVTHLLIEPLPGRKVLRDLILEPLALPVNQGESFFLGQTQYWGCTACGACDSHSQKPLEAFFSEKVAQTKAFQMFLNSHLDTDCPQGLPLNVYYSNLRRSSLKKSLQSWLGLNPS